MINVHQDKEMGIDKRISSAKEGAKGFPVKARGSRVESRDPVGLDRLATGDPDSLMLWGEDK